MTEAHSRHVMIPHQLVMVMSTCKAHAQLALLARMRSVLLVSLVTHVTENRGRGFVCVGLVVQVRVGLQVINETNYTLTTKHKNDRQVLCEVENISQEMMASISEESM